jgi:hypothetical protein
MHGHDRPSLLDPRDDPSAPSPADLDVALHVLRDHENRLLALERHGQSWPVRVQLPGGWLLAGKGWHLIVLALLGVTALVAWLRLR